MSLPAIVTQHTDEAVHRRRISETVNGILRFQNDDSRIQTPAEQQAGVTPVNYAFNPFGYDVRRCGVVPNDASAASANTSFLKALLDPTKTGITGRLFFPNTTGSDVYYFNKVAPGRRGLHLDLMGSELNCTGVGTTADNNSGFLFFLGDTTIENGTLTIVWDPGTSTGGSGAAIQIGARGTDSSYFTVYDSLLAAPLGNVILRRLRINMTLTGNSLTSSAAIDLIGGIQNLTIEDVVINGNGTLQTAIGYEFGWATNDAQPSARQSSHMHHVRIHNVRAYNMDNVASTSAAVLLVGPYSVNIDTVWSDASNVVFIYAGEAMNFRPWIGVDDVGAKRNISLSNITGVANSNTSITVDGTITRAAATGYLQRAWVHNTAYGVRETVVNSGNMYVCTVGGTSAGSGGPTTTGTGIVDGTVTWNYVSLTANTDLYDVTIDGFAITGSLTTSYGIYVKTGHAQVQNGTISGCFRGIVMSDECVRAEISHVRITGCGHEAIMAGDGVAIWNPVRLKKFQIFNCKLAGNSVASAGSYAAINASNFDCSVIETNRFGYTTVDDFLTETTQGPAVQIAGSTFSQNLTVRNNVVGAAVGGVGFANSTTSANFGNVVQNNNGVVAISGAWRSTANSLSVLTYGASITPNCLQDNAFSITATNGTAFTINAPTNTNTLGLGEQVRFIIRNTFGGLGVLTWNAIYKLGAAWTQPGAGSSRSIIFQWDGAALVEQSRTAADVTN